MPYELLVKVARLLLVVVGHRGVERHEQDVVGTKSGVIVEGLNEILDQKPRRHQQHGGYRHLADNQQIAHLKARLLARHGEVASLQRAGEVGFEHLEGGRKAEDSHTGICLGFDIPGDCDLDVHYQPNLIQIRGPEEVTEDLQLKMLRTKHESWSYEQEVRLIVKINDPPDEKGLWWHAFGPQLELKEVIVGAQCAKNDLNDLEDALKRYGDVIERSWAYMRKDAFLLVRHPFSPHWFR